MSPDRPTASDERRRAEIESVLRDIQAAQEEAGRDFRPELSAVSPDAAPAGPAAARTWRAALEPGPSQSERTDAEGVGPLLAPGSVRLDRDGFERLLRTILNILRRWTGDARDNEAIDKPSLSEDYPALLLADAVSGGGALHERAKAHDMDGNVFALAVRYALRPFLGAYARELERKGRLDPESPGSGAGGGRCPVCGAEPFMAEFDEEDGRKRLSCGLCGTKWRFPRLKCSFCGSEDQPKLGYLEVEGLEGYRACVCDVCRRYVKAVDRRVVSPAPSPELADALTPELDEAALERGYCSGSSAIC